MHISSMPFPKHPLADVPVEYIMQRLQQLAPHYWSKPETANCTLVIPTHHSSLPSQRSPADPSATRRPKLADVDSAPRMTFRLHTEYLSTKSVFLRGLLSGVSPLDLVQKLYASRLQTPSVPLRVPRGRLPRILPSPPSHPVIFLPVPDPSSIQLLIHWMYFGNTDQIEHALDQGDIQWEGLVRNVEYLGLSTDIKVFLGHYYRSWFLPARCSPDSTPCLTDDEDEDDEDEDEDESDVDSEGDDSDYDNSYFSTTPPTDDEDCDRGRTRDVKPLVQLCGQFQLCTT